MLSDPDQAVTATSIDDQQDINRVRAVVDGKPLDQLPDNLYIPPDALEIFLESFQGPLDLLIYLIKKQNLDILNIPIAQITRQYMQYIDMMQGLKLELAAEYLVMAALLAEIKSRMLLPRRETDDDEIDPRAELIRRLQEYQCIQRAANDLDALPRKQRDIFPTDIEAITEEKQPIFPEVQLQDLLIAFQDVLQRVNMFSRHQIQRELLSVRERMTQVLASLQNESFQPFSALFTPEEGRGGAVVTLLAILELLKAQLVDMIQRKAFAPIYLRSAS